MQASTGHNNSVYPWTQGYSDILPVVAPIQSRPFIAQPKIESTLSNEEQLAQIRAKREAAERLGSTLLTPESVPRTLPPLQPKLTIGQPGDQYEQEADTVARQVVDQINAPPKIQAQAPRQVAARINAPPKIQTKAPRNPMQSVGERKPSPLDHLPVTKVQRHATGGQMDASPDLESSIQRARGGGQPLDDGIRERMEEAFGADFSGVRVHTDGTSDQLNQSIQAKAFTTGQDVFFRKGAYEPGSKGGQELLAHELTHVVQQSGEKVQRQTYTPIAIGQHRPHIQKTDKFCLQRGHDEDINISLPPSQRDGVTAQAVIDISIRFGNKKTPLNTNSSRHKSGPWTQGNNARYYFKSATFSAASGDAEVKVLSEVTALIEEKEENAYEEGATIQGTVVLFTNKGPCRSCRAVIKNFHNDHPGLKVIVRYMQTDAQEKNTGNTKVSGMLGYEDAQKNGDYWEKQFMPLN